MYLIAALVLLLAGGFASFVASRPSTYHVARSRTIGAPPEAVFAQAGAGSGGAGGPA